MTDIINSYANITNTKQIISSGIIKIEYETLINSIDNNRILICELYQTYYNHVLNNLSKPGSDNIFVNHYFKLYKYNLDKINQIVKEYYEIKSFLDALDEFKSNYDVLELLLEDILKYLRTNHPNYELENLNLEELSNIMKRVQTKVMNNLNFSLPFAIIISISSEGVVVKGVRNNHFVIYEDTINMMNKYNDMTFDGGMTHDDIKHIITYGPINTNHGFTIYGPEGTFDFEIQYLKDSKNLNEISDKEFMIINKPKKSRILFNFINREIILDEPVKYHRLFSKKKEINKWINQKPDRREKIDQLFNTLKDGKMIRNLDSFYEYIYSIKKS